jgi:hypothetical protein
MCRSIYLCHQCLVLHPASDTGGENSREVTPVKSASEASGASAPLTSLSLEDSIPTLSPPVLTPHPPLDWEHLTSLCEDPSSPHIPTGMQMPLKEAQIHMYYDQEGQIQGGGQTFVYQPFTTTDLLN